MLHRDLKPANVMIDGRGRVRITDFKLAVAAGEELPSGDASGTPAYMAPEQFAGKGASVRSDIYALGGLDQIRETYRQTWGFRWLDDIRQDLRFGIRTLAKNSGFTAVGLLVLAPGIGVNTAIFSIVNAVLFRVLPVADLQELVYVYANPQGDASRSIIRKQLCDSLRIF